MEEVITRILAQYHARCARAPRYSRPLLTAFLCGAVPIAIGTAILLAFDYTRQPLLEIALLFLLPIAFACLGVGCNALYHALAAHHPPTWVPSRRNWFAAATAATTLLSGPLLAGYYIVLAMEIATQYRITVRNQSSDAIESGSLIGPGIQVELAPLARGAEVLHRLDFVGDGSLTFTIKQVNRNPLSGMIEGYVTGNLSGDAELQISGDGGVTVRHPRDLR